MTYVVQAAIFTACVATGNIALAVATVALAVMMDTPAGDDLQKVLNNNLPPLAASITQALIMVVMVVGAAATGDFALAGQAAVEETAGMLGEEAAGVAAEGATEAGTESAEVADEAKKGKSLGKTLAGIGLMTGSTTLMEDNFVENMVKHMRLSHYLIQDAFRSFSRRSLFCF